MTDRTRGDIARELNALSDDAKIAVYLSGFTSGYMTALVNAADTPERDALRTAVRITNAMHNDQGQRDLILTGFIASAAENGATQYATGSLTITRTDDEGDQ